MLIDKADVRGQQSRRKSNKTLLFLLDISIIDVPRLDYLVMRLDLGWDTRCNYPSVGDTAFRTETQI